MYLVIEEKHDRSPVQNDVWMFVQKKKGWNTAYAYDLHMKTTLGIAGARPAETVQYTQKVA